MKCLCNKIIISLFATGFLLPAFSRAVAQDKMSAAQANQQQMEFELRRVTDINAKHWAHIDQFETVDERRPAEFRAKGIRSGSLVFLPRIRSGIRYTDNVFATDNIKDSDVIHEVGVGSKLYHILPDQLLYGEYKFDAGYFKNNNTENYQDHRFILKGSKEISRQVSVFADINMKRVHEARESEASVVEWAEPGLKTQYNAVMGAIYNPNKLSIRTEAGVFRGRYGEVASRPNNVDAEIQSDRDRDRHNVAAEVSYELAPQRTVYTRFEANNVDYRRREFQDGVTNDYTGADRSSRGYEALVGSRFQLSSVLRADMGLGYLEQTYDDASLTNISGMDARVNVAWNMTPISTVKFNLERDIQETVSQGDSGILSTRYGAEFHHELRRNIKLGTHFEVRTDDYEGQNRQDDWVSYGLKVLYDMNRQLKWGLSYLFQERDSNVTSYNFTRNIVLLSLNWEL